MADRSQTTWVCSVCGYVHYGPEPPDFCPICDSPAEVFELETVPQTKVIEAVSPRKIAVIGGGIAGVSAVEAARRTNPVSEIVLIGCEPGLPYYRLNLTRYLAGEIAAGELPVHPEEWYREQNIGLMSGVEVTTVDPAGKHATLADGSRQYFDKLVLAAGANPFVPPIPGVERTGVHTLRTVVDADRILAAGGAKPRCVVIGGGLLGLESAGALAQRGLQVTVLESAGWLLPRQLNQTAGELLEEYVHSLGISLRKNAQTAEITGEKNAAGILLKEGDFIPAGLVIVSTGVRSNLGLARAAGLKTNLGIVVEDSLVSSNPDIYAAGDIAEHAGVMYGIWPPAQLQGTVAGTNAAGGQATFRGVPRSAILKVLGYDLLSVGQVVPEAGDETFSGGDRSRYCWFVVRGGCLIGAILMRDTTAAGAVKKAVEMRLNCAPALARSREANRLLEFIRSSV